MSKPNKYHPEPYWSEVSERILEREKANIIAGDDEPYYRYKRKKFLEIFNAIDFENKSVLEIGSGPGGNLVHVLNGKPSRTTGVDISQGMIDVAAANLGDKVELIKINGTELPFDDDTFDIVFSVTVLQHNTDEPMLEALIDEMVRVCKKEIYIFERIEESIKGDELCLGRPIFYYNQRFEKSKLKIVRAKFLNIQASYILAGITRKLLNSSSRKEGEPLNKFSILIQNIFLPFCKLLDGIIDQKRDLGMLHYVRKEQ